MKEAAPSDICVHCGQPISRFFMSGQYRNWYHTETKQVGCPHNTVATPRDDSLLYDYDDDQKRKEDK